MPRELIHAAETAVVWNRLDRRPNVAGPMHGILISQRGLHLAERRRPLKQRPLGFGPGEFHIVAFELRIALALLAMVVREEDPLDALDANLREMVQDAAIAEVDQNGRVAIANDVDVAGVGPEEDVGEGLVDRRELARSIGRIRRRSGRCAQDHLGLDCEQYREEYPCHLCPFGAAIWMIPRSTAAGTSAGYLLETSSFGTAPSCLSLQQSISQICGMASQCRQTHLAIDGDRRQFFVGEDRPAFLD